MYCGNILDTGDETLSVLPTELPALTPGHTDVQVEDQSEGGPVVGTVTPASVQSAPALGGRKLAVIVFNFANDQKISDDAIVGLNITRGCDQPPSAKSLLRRNSATQVSSMGRPR